MKPLSDDTIEQFEEVAVEGLKKLREFFKYEGSEARYMQKAKVAATAIAAFTRLRASESNRMAIELMAEKQGAVEARTLPTITRSKRLTE